MIGPLVIVWFTCSLSAGFAQAPSPKEPFERFSVGVRMGISGLDTIKGGDGTVFFQNLDLFTGELLSVTTITTVAEAPIRRFAWGPTLQLNFTPKIGLTLELMTKTVEFQTSIIIDETDAASINSVFVSSELERTEARYWDFPVLLRYYLNAPGDGPRGYFTGGVTFRNVGSLKGALETVSPADLENGTSDTVDITPEPANKTALGSALGIGIQLTDDVGVKLEIEARFTRWLQRSFATGFANSNQNQAEVMIGFTF